jgi:SAM-dependent methyltransferase
LIVLALKSLPVQYREWNLAYGAPFGRPVPKKRVVDYFRRSKSIEELRGPFSIQVNNTTREFEYPWAFYSGGIKSGMRVLELGGGLSGFQFVLDKNGCEVVNVDPGLDAKGIGWPCDLASMERLNRLFDTRVQLRNTTIENAGVGENTVDRAFSISVIEHLTDADMQNATKHIYRCLKPGGLFILTIDLFLNLHPFCSRLRNEFGRNQDVRSIAESENWEIVVGNQEQLFGFDTFATDSILSNLETYLIGQLYPVLVQCLILKKSEDSA